MATATRRARATAASATAGGYKPSNIGARARAAVSALSAKLNTQQFGRHAAPSSYGSARANATGRESQPRHGYNARHASGFESSGSGGGNGRHASWFRAR